LRLDLARALVHVAQLGVAREDLEPFLAHAPGVAHHARGGAFPRELDVAARGRIPCELLARGAHPPPAHELLNEFHRPSCSARYATIASMSRCVRARSGHVSEATSRASRN